MAKWKPFKSFRKSTLKKHYFVMTTDFHTHRVVSFYEEGEADLENTQYGNDGLYCWHGYAEVEIPFSDECFLLQLPEKPTTK